MHAHTCTDFFASIKVTRFDLPGMVQSITWAPDNAVSIQRSTRMKPNPASDSGGNMFYCAFSKSTIWGFDRRAGAKVSTLENTERNILCPGTKRCQEIGNTSSSKASGRNFEQGSPNGTGGMINTVRIPLDGSASCVASGDSKGRVRLWSCRTGRCIQEWQAGEEKRPVRRNNLDLVATI